jgi:hypothetical protein
MADQREVSVYRAGFSRVGVKQLNIPWLIIGELGAVEKRRFKNQLSEKPPQRLKPAVSRFGCKFNFVETVHAPSLQNYPTIDILPVSGGAA